MSEVGSLSRNFAELSGRTEPLIADVILTFVEMGTNKLNAKFGSQANITFVGLGYNFNNLMKYVKSSKHISLPSIQPQQPQKQLNMLTAGSKMPLPPYIPQHLPQFPDPHAYVRTPVSFFCVVC